MARPWRESNHSLCTSGVVSAWHCSQAMYRSCSVNVGCLPFFSAATARVQHPANTTTVSRLLNSDRVLAFTMLLLTVCYLNCIGKGCSFLNFQEITKQLS